MAHGIDENSSMLILKKEGESTFLFSQYDQGYGYAPYKFRVNLMGGAEDKFKLDINPLHTQLREIVEESIYKDITLGIIRNLSHYRDFFSTVKRPDAKKMSLYISIDSAFFTELDKGLFQTAEERLRKGENIVSEGLVKVVSADELIKGDVLTAWSTGEIMSHYLEKEIPNPEGNISVPILLPMGKTHQDYRRIFSYKE